MEPLFSAYAESVIFLYQRYLNSNPDGSEEAVQEDRKRKLQFQFYVVGMSLSRLEHRLREPKWKYRSVEQILFHAFLDREPTINETFLKDGRIDQQWETSTFQGYVQEVETVSKTLDISSSVNIIIVYHKTLAYCVTEIQSKLRFLQNQPFDSGAVQEKHLTAYVSSVKDILFSLSILTGCIVRCPRILKDYIQATSTEKDKLSNPKTPPHGEGGNDNDDDEEEAIEARQWGQAYAE